MAFALEFDRVSKRYRGGLRRPPVFALNDFSLQVEQGEIFGFLGANGAGKTTAIHIAMGFMLPSAGGGRMLGQPFGHAPARARVGFVAENVALYHRPAARLVRFYGRLNGVTEPQLSQRATQVLQEVGLTADAGRNVGRFSRGMLQRVGIAQALVNDPELLVLDEPTSALDPMARVSVRELLLRARAAGKTVFLSSHLLSEVEMICDRIAILHKGRLVRMGKTSELLESTDRMEVVARGVDAALLPGGEARDGFTTFTIAASAQRAAFERIWTAGGEVVRANPVRNSLESIFVELARAPEAERKP